MSDKKFLTLDQQINHLTNEKKISCDDNSKLSLLRIGYFNLVNGYKTPFTSSKDKDGNHIYAKGTTLNQIIQLKEFDDSFRHLLLKTITKVEEEIRTITSYLLEKSKDAKLTWRSTKSYNHDIDIVEIQKLISRISQQIKERDSLEYVNFYRSNHSRMPMWIITKILFFGTFIDLIECAKPCVSDELCNIYTIKNANDKIDKKLLTGSLHWLRIVRNACAHNERIYCLSAKGRIFEKEIQKLGKRYMRDRKRKIFDLFIYLRYYMPKNEYQSFMIKVKEMIINLQNNVTEYAFENIRGGMGIKSIDDLDILIEDASENNYDVLLFEK